MKEIICFENVCFGYNDGRDVLSEVSFSLKAGENVGIVGANGTGKSTIMKLLVGLLAPKSGKAVVCGLEVNKGNLKEIRKRVGFIMQDSDSQLFMSNVYEDICFGPRNYGFSEEEVKRRAEEAMAKVGCEKLKGRAVHKLSGGEKKLAAIATILSMEPDIIIMDEPESSLDPANRKRLIRVIKELEATKIIASHDLDFIWETTDKIILLGDGGIVASGDTKSILSDENLLNQYSLTVPPYAIIEKLKKQIGPTE